MTSTDHCLFGVCSGPFGHAKQLPTFAASALGLVRVPLAGPGRPGEELARGGDKGGHTLPFGRNLSLSCWFRLSFAFFGFK